MRRYLVLFLAVVFWSTPSLPDEKHEFFSEDGTVKLDNLTQSLLDKARYGADAGLCSREVYEVGAFLEDLIFYDANADYRAGIVIHGKNAGVENYFSHGVFLGREFIFDVTAFLHIIEQTDRKYPPLHTGATEHPSIDAISPVNFFKEVLKITHGNAYKAVSLIGYLGHDDQHDYTGPEWISNLYAMKSIGEGDIDPLVLAKFRKAGERGGKLKDCAGAEALNYHVNFGFYLGCQLAKRGFRRATINKLFADGMIHLFDDPFLAKDLACRTTEGRGPLTCYQFDLCSDVPRILDYLYKRATLHSRLSYVAHSDPLDLFNLGYRTPFQAEEKDPSGALPAHETGRRRDFGPRSPILTST